MTDDLTPDEQADRILDARIAAANVPCDQLAAVRDWLKQEALKIRHRLPAMDVPEVWRSMDGMAHGLGYTVRVIDSFVATGKLPVTGGAECDCADPEAEHPAMAVATHERARAERDDELAQLRATNQRLNLRCQQAESKLATFTRAVAEWKLGEHGTYAPLRTLTAIAKAAGREVDEGGYQLHYQRVDELEAQVAAVREYVATSDDDGIRTREQVLAIVGELPAAALDAAPTPEADPMVRARAEFLDRQRERFIASFDKPEAPNA